MKLTLLSASIILASSFFTGCTPEKEYIYIYRDCAKLQTYEVKTKHRDPLDIQYVIKEREVE